jgi:two-component system, chemotaxis family, sensor kinase Cph1
MAESATAAEARFRGLLEVAPDPIVIVAEHGTIEIVNRQTEVAVGCMGIPLERSNRELEQFAYVASHDLQEPLRMVASYTQLLARRYKDKLDSDTNAAVDQVISDLGAAIADSAATVTREDLPPGLAPVVHVSARSTDTKRIFSVRDNGIGIEPQYVERIFTLFQRLHSRAEYPGTGIGLAICKKIVERHGGHIEVHSEPGSGTTFEFALPVRGEA